MLRRFLLLLPFSAFAVRADSDENERRKVELTFDKFWGEYLLQEYGCVTDTNYVSKPIKPEDCNPNTATINAVAFLRARELAKKVFNLHE